VRYADLAGARIFVLGRHFMAAQEFKIGGNVKRTLIVCLIWVLELLPNCLAAQTKVEISVNADYRNLAARKPIAPDFAGLSFEITSVMPGTNGLATGVHLFDPQANPQPLVLFQQIGIKSLRVGAATGDGCRTPFPTHADLDALFHFAKQANLKIIYQFRMRNPVSCDIPDLEQQSAETAHYLWSRYAQNIAVLSIGNEVDYHTAHSYCTDGNACACIESEGCSCQAHHPQCAHPRSGNATPALVILDPQMYEVGVSEAMTNAGSAFPSYLEEWRKYIGAITAMPGLANAPVAGPDAFSYTMEARFTGNVCGSRFTSAAWPQLLAACEKNDPKLNFLASYGHYYVGGNPGSGPYKLTAAQAIANMLSPAWMHGDGVSADPAQPSGIPRDQQLVYTPYSWLYKNNYEPIRKLGVQYRLTESNDYLIGVPGASNAFASALWALDYMHWWAEHGASGVNFHNNQWISTDTLAPRNNVWKAPGACTQSSCADYYVTPKGYGIKAFNIGGHGYPLETSIRTSNVPKDWSLTAYAVGAGQNLYITVINKMQGNEPDHVAQVTINPGGVPFANASVATMTLSSGIPGDATRLTAQLAGATIANTGEQWRGAWTPRSTDVSGHVTLMIEPATAVIVHFHAGSRYAGPIGINENGALEVFAADQHGRLWHARQKSDSDLVAEPNSVADRWSNWSDEFSEGLPAVSGGLAIARNQDDTLQAFAATAKDVYTARQETPDGTWSHWTPLEQPGCALNGLQAAQNADGSLSVFGLDPEGGLWMATEAAPGVAWSSWKKLPKLAGGVQPGFAVVENLSGRISVFALDRSAHPAVWQIGQTLENSWDERWFSLGGPHGQILQSGLQVGRTLAGNLTVFALDKRNGQHSGNLWSIAQDSPRGDWSSWSALPVVRGVSLHSGFVNMQNSDGRFELIAAGSNGNIYRLAEKTGGDWEKTWKVFSGTDEPDLTHSVFFAGNTNDGRLQVFATDATGRVYSNWQQTPGGEWENRWNAIGGHSGFVFNPQW
jgi:hypothetical protein